MDKGPWEVYYVKPEKGPIMADGVVSDDFRRDVVLQVSGDFPDNADKLAYCLWLRDKLNAN